jgi:hypothetical protein
MDAIERLYRQEQVIAELAGSRDAAVQPSIAGYHRAPSPANIAPDPD